MQCPPRPRRGAEVLAVPARMTPADPWKDTSDGMVAVELTLVAGPQQNGKEKSESHEKEEKMPQEKHVPSARVSNPEPRCQCCHSKCNKSLLHVFEILIPL